MRRKYGEVVVGDEAEDVVEALRRVGAYVGANGVFTCVDSDYVAHGGPFLEHQGQRVVGGRALQRPGGRALDADVDDLADGGFAGEVDELVASACGRASGRRACLRRGLPARVPS